MFSEAQPFFLLASNDPALLRAVEPVLLASGARVTVVLSAETALEAAKRPVGPNLALIDANLPGLELDQFLVAMRDQESDRRFPIVLMAEEVNEQWLEWLTNGIIDDFVPHCAESPYWRLRLDLVLRAYRKNRELELLREVASVGVHNDPLTGVYNRGTLLSLLFSETDRVQRMNTSLCTILFDIDDFAHWNAVLGPENCDRLLIEVIGRVRGLLRSYDLLGRMGSDEFLVVLPGCSAVNGFLLAERIRSEVFSEPFPVGESIIRLSACFAISSSQGRSPVLVLRELEESLRLAKAAGPETIQCAPENQQMPSEAFLSPLSSDDLLAW